MLAAVAPACALVDEEDGLASVAFILRVRTAAVDATGNLLPTVHHSRAAGFENGGVAVWDV